MYFGKKFGVTLLKLNRHVPLKDVTIILKAVLSMIK